MTRCLRLAVPAFAALVLTLPAHAEDDPPVASLAPVLVRGLAATSLTVPDERDAARALARIPGNVSLVPAAEYRQGAMFGLSDALARSPGVHVQNPGGQETARLSIRGAGLSNAFGVRGVRLLRDGLPLSRADDAADTPYADPATADYIEVYRGGNALQYGAATLGGAINLVSPTGYSLNGARLRMEAGSNGYVRGQAQAGRVFDDGLDAFVSASHMETDGSRPHAGQRISRLYANVGYRFTPTSEGRLHLDVERQRQEMPGALRLSQLLADPYTAEPTAAWTGRTLEVGPRHNVAYQHAWRVGPGETIKAGIYRTATRFEVQGGPARLRYDAVDYGIALRHELADGPAGFTWGMNLADGRSTNASFGPIGLGNLVLAPAPVQYEDIGGTRTTLEIFGEARYALSPTLTLVAGAQAVRAWRTNDVNLLRPSPVLPVPPHSPIFREIDHAARYSGFSPKLGLLWQAAADVQVYANLNRSFEPPSTLEFGGADGTVGAQRATTLEIGTRGRHEALRWDVALYHSRVRDELLSVEWPLGSNRYVTGNIPHTTHTGLEAALAGTWPAPRLGGHVEGSLAYTWSRFRIRGDGAFGGNTLPGLPPHYARLDLRFRHATGLYAGPSLELAAGWYADQANTLRAPGYGIVNFTVGYAPPGERFLVFLDARNLADRHYVATTDWLADARGVDAPVFNPGAGRAFIAGVQIGF